MNGPLVLGIAAYARTGKDTFARMAVASLYSDHKIPSNIVSFASALKQSLDPVFMQNLGISAYTDNSESKNIIRPVMVAWGEACRKISPDFWVAKVASFTEAALASGYSVIIPDVRYVNEEKWIHSMPNSRVIVLNRRGIKPPNKEEKEQIPALKEVADRIVKWPKVGEDAASNPKLMAIVRSTLKELYE